METREPNESDWDEILRIANAAVAHVSDAGTQEEWLRNRRAGGPGADQFHFVCAEEGGVVGYAAAESAPDALDQYRLFVVTTNDLLESAGEEMLAALLSYLERVGAARSWFLEYRDDEAFARFQHAHGYSDEASFEIGGGIEVVRRSRVHAAAD